MTASRIASRVEKWRRRSHGRRRHAPRRRRCSPPRHRGGAPRPRRGSTGRCARGRAPVVSGLGCHRRITVAGQCAIACAAPSGFTLGTATTAMAATTSRSSSTTPTWRAARQVGAPAAADRHGEMHAAQPQRRANGKRDLLVHGPYQSGIGVLDFSNPANAEEIAYADPAPLSETQLISGATGRSTGTTGSSTSRTSRADS
jgi:hypothetical protein